MITVNSLISKTAKNEDDN